MEVMYCISYGIYSVQYREAGVDAMWNRRSLFNDKLFGSLWRMSIKIRDSSSVAYRGEVGQPDRCPSVERECARTSDQGRSLRTRNPDGGGLACASMIQAFRHLKKRTGEEALQVWS